MNDPSGLASIGDHKFSNSVCTIVHPFTHMGKRRYVVYKTKSS